MRRVVRSSHPYPQSALLLCHTASHESITNNFNAYILSIVVGQTVRRSTLTTQFVSSSRDSGSVFVLRLLSCRTSTFCSCFLFHIFLVLAFIDSSAFLFVLCLIMLRFVNHILPLISKAGHYTLLHEAYIVRSW